MKTKPSSQSALSIIRLVVAIALFAFGGALGWLSFASTPASGILTPATPELTYDAGPFPVANQSPLGLGQLDQGPRCSDPQFPCDNYNLTVTLPTGYVATYPNAAIKVSMYWTNTATDNAASDYDIYIFAGTVGNLTGNNAGIAQGASSANPEVANIGPLTDGTSTYTFKIVPYQPAAETVHVRIELLTGAAGAGYPGFGQADPTTPGSPRFQVFAGGATPTSGEFNIGVNNTTGLIMTMNSGPVWRITPAERKVPAQPECCAELWENKSNQATNIGVDPILWTDNWTDANPLPNQPASGARHFSANSTAGTNGVYGFSDDDGNTWLPLSASPPNASSDHETIGSGPYPALLSGLGTPQNHGHAVYYCAQTFPVGAAACQRSDTYGDSYGPSTLPYTGNAGDLCGGIHGHVKVGPDGTVYLPVRDCSGNAGLSVSMDAGVTWTEHAVPNSMTQTHGSDPSIAIGANNTVYFFYVAGNADASEGRIHVQVSTDHGATWSKDTDLGASHGVINAVFPEAVGGDDNRAAVGFLGTDRPGFYEGATFPGYWYLFIATTYDGGNTWTVVNAIPNDPVQGVGGIWQGGGSNTNRNLLDFNEVTMDGKGRVLFGFDDGCTGACIGNPANNTYKAAMRVARQIGGKGLLSSFDVSEPAVPKAPCLSATRNASGVHLTWKAPDNGGANIVSYNIYRGTASGNETFLINTGNTKLTYDDITADPTQSVYYYVRAVNSVDAAGGTNSQEVNFAATPGIQLLGITSSKVHGGAGTFDMNVPLNGSAIECRTGGVNGDFTLVFDFANSVTSVTTATVAAGTASVSSTAIQNGNYVVNLTGVTNAQRLTVTLTGVTDSAGNTSPSVSATMGVLLGDTTADGSVNSADIGQTKSQSGNGVSGSNFRQDVTIDGNLNSADIGLVKSKSGTALP